MIAKKPERQESIRPCGTLLLSYLVGLFSKRFRVPAVLILLAIGMALRPVLDETGTAIPDLSMVLQLLGVLGLIFIVLEAALDLGINRRSYKALIKGLASSVLLLVASTVGIAYVLVAYFDTCFWDLESLTLCKQEKTAKTGFHGK